MSIEVSVWGRGSPKVRYHPGGDPQADGGVLEIHIPIDPATDRPGSGLDLRIRTFTKGSFSFAELLSQLEAAVKKYGLK